MQCTEDLRITEVLEESLSGGVVKVEVAVEPDFIGEFYGADEVGISTRSSFARNFSDFYVLSDDLPVVNEGMLEATLGYRNLAVPICYSEGDHVARVYVLNKKDRLEGGNLHDLVASQEMPVEVAGDKSAVSVPLQDKRYVIESPQEMISASHLLKDRNQFLREVGHENWRLLSDNMLLLSEDLVLPEGIFGVIRGTSWEGGTYHLNSPVVDPGWKGSVIFEVLAKDDSVLGVEKPAVSVEFYRST